jgi:hypothetical protein
MMKLELIVQVHPAFYKGRVLLPTSFRFQEFPENVNLTPDGHFTYTILHTQNRYEVRAYREYRMIYFRLLGWSWTVYIRMEESD